MTRRIAYTTGKAMRISAFQTHAFKCREMRKYEGGKVGKLERINKINSIKKTLQGKGADFIA